MDDKIENKPSFSELSDNAVISVGEARKILGRASNESTDEELMYLVYDLSELAKELLKYKHFA